MNPFIERKGELITLHLKKDKIAADIKKLKADLEAKISALTEVHQNMLKDVDREIREFPRICDHTDEDGNIASDKEHKILIPGLVGDITVVKKVCILCGGTISEEKIEVKTSTEKVNEFTTWYHMDDDDTQDFIETLTFDPNFFNTYASTFGTLFSGKTNTFGK
jgi:hypothetical protein